MKTSTQLRILLGAMMVTSAAPLAMATRSNNADRFQVIITRKPFGALPEKPIVSVEAALPPPEPLVDPHAPPPGAFIEKLRICAMTETDFGLRVGIVDLGSKPQSVYFLYAGEAENGIEVVEANYADESVLLRKDDEAYWLGMNDVPGGSGKKPRTSKPDLVTKKASSSRKMSYADRLKRRRELEAQRLEKLSRPRELSGEELKVHIRQMQMDAIRTGKPPLPIPLTQEMDDQLVQEGVLPPME